MCSIIFIHLSILMVFEVFILIFVFSLTLILSFALEAFLKFNDTWLHISFFKSRTRKHRELFVLLTMKFTLGFCWALSLWGYLMSFFLDLSSWACQGSSVSTCKVFACVLEAEGGEEGYRPQHRVCILSFNHLVSSTVPLPLTMLMFRLQNLKF